LAIDHDFSGLDQALCLLARVTESTINKESIEALFQEIKV